MIVQLKDNVSVEDFVAQTGMVFVRKLKLRKDYYLFKYDEVNHKNGLDSIPVLSLKTMAVSYERNKYHDNVARAYTPSDSLFSEQFHLKNTGQYDGKTGVGVNVSPVWDLGYFGEDITISIVDDGLDHAHEDLSSNFLMKGSWDYCLDQNDPVGTTEDTHGTSCAGVAAATDGDGACGLGVAPKANLMARRILCSGATDAEIAEALSDESEGVFHVSSNSYGPVLCRQTDCDYYVQPSIIKDAIVDAVENGRDGKGIVFIWAVGNEADYGGDVNFDRSSKMAQVIGVAAVNIDGGHSTYSNVGSALVVSGVSSGYNSNDTYIGIRTTDRATTTSCRDDFGGTSSACPLVAGVVALILEANPKLNYWQVQQIIIETATREHLPTENWIQNSEGYYYHRHFGFGLVDASAAVDAALEWDANPSFEQFETDLRTVNKIIPDGGGDSDFLLEKIQIDIDLTIVGGVEIQISITHDYIGDIGIILESPSGTQIDVIVPHKDYHSEHLDNYPLFVKNFYGESSKGEWYIFVDDRSYQDQGTVYSLKLIFYGISDSSDPTPTPDPSDEVSISNFVNNSFLLSFFLLAIIQFVIF
ncbi:s8 family serine peptidase [Anaeramoeba flamelloides]|uniref:S8 family serine peptidase n=1 Tax=Anaeramoeba flamelloides TaxID=1746091 RepID=A0AAV8A1K1_9EUKA|nr:s8 family serine peptidase [Anaeramoeba flamelloides]